MRGYNLKYIAVILTGSLSGFASFAQKQEFKTYTQELAGNLKFEMIAIPGDEFKMGSPENEIGRRTDEGPQHS